MSRILIDVQSLMNHAGAWRDMGELADEINSSLPDYECSLVHLDTGDFLAFAKQDPTEGEYWRGLEEENQELAGEYPSGPDSDDGRTGNLQHVEVKQSDKKGD